MIALRSWNWFLSLHIILYLQVLRYLFHIFKFFISYLFSVFHYIFRFSLAFVFSGFTFLLSYQAYFLNLSFFTYILVYFQVTYWHTDILTYRQWWFHRIPFRLKEEVQKSTVKLQQFSRVSGKNLPSKKPRLGVRGRAGVRLGIGLGLESGGLFSGGLFSQNLWDL